jgi:hypothetical protein
VTYTAPIGLIRNANGWIIVHDYNSTGYSDTHVYFSQVFDDCTTSIGLSNQDLEIEMYQGYVDLAVGNGNGFAVAFSTSVDGGPGTVALFGPNICDDPDQ